MSEVFLGICQADLSWKERYWLHAACTLSQRFLILTRPPSLNKLLEEVRICMPTRTTAKRCHISDFPLRGLSETPAGFSQSAISTIWRISVALRLGVKSTATMMLLTGFLQCGFYLHWDEPSLLLRRGTAPHTRVQTMLHRFPLSLYGYPFHTTTHAEIQIHVDLVDNLWNFYGNRYGSTQAKVMHVANINIIL